MKLLILIIVALVSHSNHIRSEENDQEKRPNILLIVADDLGWSDMGSFGGEINTPNLDALAFNGIRLTNFYTAPTCSPTRAMLLSGTDSHLAGLGNMEEELGPNQKGKNGYEGYLNENVVSFAALLQDAGYKTMMSGKWHLGASLALGPESRGFDDAFVIANGISNHFKQERIVGFDINTITKAPYRENRKEITLEEPFYSSELYTDKLIEYIKDHQATGDSKSPFFAYAAYSAPHWPLQAPQNFIKKYNSKYHIGYEEIRKKRFKKMKELGIISTNIDPISSELWPTWNELDKETKKKEAKRMAVYAAMVEAMDFHIGRLIDFLEKSDELDNTMIIFLSDNGAEGNDPRVILENRVWIPQNFDNSIENMGNFDSHISYGPKWAEVSASPYKGYKGFTSEGGIKSPAFITYKGFKRQKSINDVLLSVMDIAPTILEIANIKHPGDRYKGRQVYPIKGKSMINFLMNKKNYIHSKNHVMGWELFNRIAIRHDNWKLVFIEPPHGNRKWSLYDLNQDPLEQNDLADIKSDKLNEMISYWYAYRDQNGVIIDNDMRLGYSGSNAHYDH